MNSLERYILCVLFAPAILMARPETNAISESVVHPKTLHWSKLNSKQKGSILESLHDNIVCIKATKEIVQAFSPTYSSTFSSIKHTIVKQLQYEPVDHATINSINSQKWVRITATIQQSIGGSLYLLSLNDDKTIYAEIPGNTYTVDGDSIDGFGAYVGPYDYTTVLGAHQRVDAYILLDFRSATTQEITTAITNGQSFSVILQIKVHCHSCHGDKSVKGYVKKIISVECPDCDKNRARIKCPTCKGTRRVPQKTSVSGMVPCSSCDGTGQVDQPRCYRIAE